MFPKPSMTATPASSRICRASAVVVRATSSSPGVLGELPCMLGELPRGGPRWYAAASSAPLSRLTPPARTTTSGRRRPDGLQPR